MVRICICLLFYVCILFVVSFFTLLVFTDDGISFLVFSSYSSSTIEINRFTWIGSTHCGWFNGKWLLIVFFCLNFHEKVFGGHYRPTVFDRFSSIYSFLYYFSGSDWVLKNDMVGSMFDLLICPFFRSVAMFNTMMQFY